MEIRPISWFSELSPEKFMVFEEMKKNIKQSYILSGFLPIETPVVERKETLLSKWGDDNEIYGVHRLNGEKEDAEVALRFDLTVPLARYVAQYESSLKFPFKRCHIDKVWRGERAQTWRAREFYQSDVDIIGREKLSLFADVEVISTVYTALKKIAFWDFVIHLNNKKILIGFLESIGIPWEKQAQVIGLIDKKDKLKMAKKDISPMFLEIVSQDITTKLLDFIQIEEKTFSEKIAFFSGNAHTLLQEGLFELQYVYKKLLELWIEEKNIVFNNTIARGLNYYTWTLLETFIVGAREYGSIASGGRYENLVWSFSKNAFPWVWVSIGLTRLFQILDVLRKIKTERMSYTQVLVLNLDEKYTDMLLGVVKRFREKGVVTEIYLDSTAKMKKQLEYANAKKVKFVVICGEDEATQGVFSVKNLDTWEQTTIPQSDIMSII